MNKRWLVGVALLAALTSGCVVDVDDGSGDDDTDVGEVGNSLVTENGKALNGAMLNGTALNGKSLNGKSLNGIMLNGKALNGTALSGVSLSQSNFAGKLNNVAVSNWVGVQFPGTMSDGTPVTLRIDSKTTLPAPNADVSAYGVSYQTSSGWSPLCGAATTLAIPINGTFNYGGNVAGGGSFTASATSFTWACRATAIAKCVEFGYKPWKTVNGVNLTDHMVACTRMLRADFCGDGRSWTVDGTPINLYDKLGVQTDGAAWTVEAEWTKDGAKRVNASWETRWKLNGGFPPGCYISRVDLVNIGKTANFNSGTLLMSEYQP